MHLEVTKENAEKQIFTFDKEKILVGRGKDADLRLDGEDISRKHFYLEFKDGKYFVEDLGATNGVHVNQQRLPANERTEVQTFFPLQIGAHIFINIVELADPKEERHNSSSVKMQNPASSDATMTRRISMPKVQPQQVAKAKEIEKEKEKAKAANKKPYIFLVLIVIGIGYYAYTEMTKEEAAPTTADATVLSPELQKMAEIKQKFELQLTPGQLREKKRLEADFTRLCQTEEEKTICDKLKLDLAAKDGARVVTEDNKLIVFRNLIAAAETSWGHEFDKIAPERKYDFMMSTLAIKAIKENNFKKIELIDFKIIEGVFVPLASIEIYRSGLEEYNQSMTDEILDKAKESGDLKKYDKTLRHTHIIGFFLNPAELAKGLQK